MDQTDSTTFTLVLAMEPHRNSQPFFTHSFPLSGLEMDPYQLVRLWPQLPQDVREVLKEENVTPLMFGAMVMTLYRQQVWAVRHGNSSLMCADDAGLTPLGRRVRVCVLSEREGERPATVEVTKDMRLRVLR